jgi:hypothetical protein
MCPLLMFQTRDLAHDHIDRKTRLARGKSQVFQLIERKDKSLNPLIYSYKGVRVSIYVIRKVKQG